MRLSRNDAKQNGRAALICKAYAKRGLALQAASDQCFICRRENFRFRKHPKNGILLPGFGTRLSAMSILTDRAEGEPEAVSDGRFDDADDCHFKAGRPPGTNGDQRFQRTDREMRNYADDERGHDRANTAHKEEWNDRNE